jgi:succinoglycan biosynthesis protein ExoU
MPVMPRHPGDASVAVLIPAKDAAGTIVRAVRSALSQREVAEVLVIDDGSTDGSGTSASSADDGTGRLRILRQVNAGPSAAINNGHDASRSEFVCVLDADDFFVEGRLARLFAEAGSGWTMAADRLLLAREGAEDGPYEPWAGAIPSDNRLTFAQFVAGNVTDRTRPRTELGYLQPVFRRSFIDAHGLRYNEGVRLGEDYLFYAEALARGADFRVTNSFGYVAVSRAQSLSHRHSSADLKALLEADRKLAKLPGLLPQDLRALARHSTDVRRKWVYHLALDAKAEGELGRALPTLLMNPDALCFAIFQTARARTRPTGPAASGTAELRERSTVAIDEPQPPPSVANETVAPSV